MLEQLQVLITGFSLAEFHCLRPGAFWLLFALPIIALLLYKKQGDNKEWHKVCDPELLPYVVESQNQEDKKHSWLWPLVLGLPVILALAGPVWERVPQPVFDDTAALVILLDTSLSMDAQDIKPSRIQRARLKVLDILQQRSTGQTALIAYAGAPFVVSPLTNDAKTIAALVPSLSTDIMPEQGSDVSQAIEKAVELLNNAGARGNILVISDGTQGQVLSAAINTAQQAKARISVIGIGTSNGAPIPSSGGFIKDKQGNIVVVKQETSSLRKLASQGNGNYSNLTAGDADILKTLSNNTPLENELQSTEQQADQWLEQGPWLLLPVLFLASFLFRRGVLSIAILTPLLLSSLSYSPNTQAETLDDWQWQDLFRNSEQRAAARFQAQQFDDSAQRFDDPQWKASAQFRAEDYTSAVDSLAGIDNATAHYNRGNALAKLGKVKEAIEAYESALTHDTEHEDALYNKELLEKQQEQQSDPSQDGDPSDEQQDNSSESEQQSENSESDQQETEEQESQQSAEQQSEEPKQSDPSTEQEPETEEPSEQEKSAEQQAKEAAEDEQQALEQEYKDKTQQEVEQATQQWLRRIPDKPGNLLRNQFANEYRRRQQTNPNSQSEDRPW